MIYYFNEQSNTALSLYITFKLNFSWTSLDLCVTRCVCWGPCSRLLEDNTTHAADDSRSTCLDDARSMCLDTPFSHRDTPFWVSFPCQGENTKFASAKIGWFSGPHLLTLTNCSLFKCLFRLSSYCYKITYYWCWHFLPALKHVTTSEALIHCLNCSSHASYFALRIHSAD